MKFMEALVGPGGLAQFAMEQMTGELTPDKRRVVAAGLKAWLNIDARKAAREDLADLLKEFGGRIDRMVETMSVKIVDGKPVVKASGSAQDTLRALERGTNWFDPCEDVVSVVISSLWKS